MGFNCNPNSCVIDVRTSTVESQPWAVDPKPGDHIGFLYENDEQYQSVVTSFLRQGIDRGEKALCLADASAIETISNCLERDGLKVADCLAGGVLSIPGTADTSTNEGVLNTQLMIALLRAEAMRAQTDGYPALRLVLDQNFLLRDTAGDQSLIDRELTLDGALPGSNCLCLCLYDRRRFVPALLLDVLVTHPIVIIGTQAFENFHYVPFEDFAGLDPATAKFNHWLDELTEYNRMLPSIQEAEGIVLRSEEYYCSLFDGAPVGLYRAMMDGRLLDANSPMVEMLGYADRDSICKMNLSQLFVNAADWAHFQNLLKNRKGVQGFEAPLVRQDGTVVRVRQSACFTPHGSDETLYCQGSMEQIREAGRARA